MKHPTTLLTRVAMFAAALSGPAYSQGAPQTVSLMKVDPQTAAAGYRTSKVVGSTVVNQGCGSSGTEIGSSSPKTQRRHLGGRIPTWPLFLGS
jgi:hypothetical protein